MTIQLPFSRQRIDHLASMDHVSLDHVDEFIKLLGKDGKWWDSALHPRDKNGRFIRTFSRIKFKYDPPAGSGGTPIEGRGRVGAYDPETNTFNVKVTGIDPGSGAEKTDYVNVRPDQIEVQTIKAALPSVGKGTLNGQTARQAERQIPQLEQLGMTDEVTKLKEAIRLSQTPAKSPAQGQADNDKAIDLFREVGEAVMLRRGKGFKEGADSVEAVKAEMTPEQRKEMDTLDGIAKSMYTMRNKLGDGKIDLQNDQGEIDPAAPKVRDNTAEAEYRRDSNSGATVLDLTGDTPTTSTMQPIAPTKAARTKGRIGIERQNEDVLPELRDLGYQPDRTGESRAAGQGQAQQVSPYDRFAKDKNNADVVVGSVVNYDAKTGQGAREAGRGVVSRIHTSSNGTHQVYVRVPDPEFTTNTMQNGKQVPFQEIRITTLGKDGVPVKNNPLELAPPEDQIAVFRELAAAHLSDRSASMVHAMSAEWAETLAKGRLASQDAKKRSTGFSTSDMMPVNDRVRMDANKEQIRVGDSVQSIDDVPIQGVVTYIDPSSDRTITVQTRDGQLMVRRMPSQFTRTHGATSDIYSQGGFWQANNYVATRDEAAAAADKFGAESVAQAIRDDKDSKVIQAAMSTDVNFQNNLNDVDDLRVRMNQAREAGTEPSEEDKQAYSDWMAMRSASAGIFREPNPEPPTIAEIPEVSDGDMPQDPANPKKKVTSKGTTVQEMDDGTVVVDGDTENPIDGNDQQAIDQAVEEADLGDGEVQEPDVAPEQTAQPSMADQIATGLDRMLGEFRLDPTSKFMRSMQSGVDDVKQAITDQDADGFVNALRGMTNELVRQESPAIRQSSLYRSLMRPDENGRTRPMWQEMQARVAAGQDIFGGRGGPERPQADQVVEGRPDSPVDETPEGVDAAVDKLDADMAEGLLSDDGSVFVQRGDQQVDEGYIVTDPETIAEYDNKPTPEEVADYLDQTDTSSGDGVTIWQDPDDGRFRMARVSIHDDEQAAAEAADLAQTYQFTNIADGTVHNVTMGGQDQPPEAIEDPRSEERTVRRAGARKASARTTAKQKNMLDHVAGAEGADPEITRITDAVKSGQEIDGADASRLADYIDGLDVGQFEKPSDKGVASQMAHRLARAAGEEGARGYSSQNTALRRTSDVGISLSAQSNNDGVRSLVDGARNDVKSGDMQAAAAKFREAADAYDALSLPNDAPSRRAREHADRLDAMGGVTGPAPEQAQIPNQQGGGTAREALDAAGLQHVEPLTQSKFSNPDTPRTRQVTPQEYTALALRGQTKLDSLLDGGSAPDALDGNTWDEIKTQSWDSVQEEWGGITVDAHTGQAVTGNEDAYAVTFRPPGTETVSVPIGSSQEDFDAAMEEALQRFGGEEGSPLWAQQAHLGVFRNDDTGMYEIDPVLVFDNLDDVESVGAYSGSEGGAYNFKDGLGYWPPYVAEEEAGGGAGEEGVPGARRLEGPSPEGGEAQPGLPPEGQAPPSPDGGGQEAQVAQVESALGSVDNAIDSEVQAETDSGRPQGETDAVDEARAQLGLIRGKITSEGPYTQLADDLRRLADYIESSWTGTNPRGTVLELRQAAEAVDVPETPSVRPGSEVPGQAPGAEEAPAGGPFFRTRDLPPATF